MNIDIGVIFGTLSGLAVPILVMGGIFWLVKATNLKAFKPLLDHFTTTQAKPASIVRVPQFRIGNGVAMNNAVSIAENSGQFYIKALMLPLMCIPTQEIKSVEIRDGYFKHKMVVVNFKKGDYPSLFMSLRESQLSQVQGLISMANKNSSSSNVISSSGIASNPQTTQSQNRLASITRAVFLIISLVSGGIVLLYFLQS